MTSSHAAQGPHGSHLKTLDDLAQRFDLQLLGADAATHSFTGLSVSSQDINNGEIFVAIKGFKAHGARFAQGALDRGAAGILTDTEGLATLRSGLLANPDATPIMVSADGSDLRELTARAAAWFYGEPSQTIPIAGVTGTNGKTTTTFFLDSIMRGVGQLTGLIGTIEMRLGDQHTPSVRTTVEAPVLQDFFAQARDLDVTCVSMEVSSHALSLQRVTGTKFSVVGFTNLQRDHLDFHHTMAEYFDAKAQLFTAEFADAGVINIDDEYGWKLFGQTKIEAISIASDPQGAHFYDATWRVDNVQVADHSRGVHFDLIGPHGARLSSYSPLLGSVNVANAGLATLMALQLGVSPDNIKNGLTKLAVVPGRMEVVSVPGQPITIVDYAHTTEALEFALKSLGERHCKGDGQLIVVFGAAGERDASKRPQMGRVAMELAQSVLVTDDDPYNEDRGFIRKQILDGARATSTYQSLPSQEQSARLQDFAVREDAIAAAISMATPQDTVLIAGRGHETIQDLAGVQHVLDDRAYARLVLDGYFPRQAN